MNILTISIFHSSCSFFIYYCFLNFLVGLSFCVSILCLFIYFFCVNSELILLSLFPSSPLYSLSISSLSYPFRNILLGLLNQPTDRHCQVKRPPRVNIEIYLAQAHCSEQKTFCFLLSKSSQKFS